MIKSDLQFTCNNSSCKKFQVPVSRKFDALKGFDCNFCGTPLIRRTKPSRIEWDRRAKQELKRVQG